jgi:hypothetical protein
MKEMDDFIKMIWVLSKLEGIYLSRYAFLNGKYRKQNILDVLWKDYYYPNH